MRDEEGSCMLATGGHFIPESCFPKRTNNFVLLDRVRDIPCIVVL